MGTYNLAPRPVGVSDPLAWAIQLVSNKSFPDFVSNIEYKLGRGLAAPLHALDIWRKSAKMISIHIKLGS